MHVYDILHGILIVHVWGISSSEQRKLALNRHRRIWGASPPKANYNIAGASKTFMVAVNESIYLRETYNLTVSLGILEGIEVSPLLEQSIDDDLQTHFSGQPWTVLQVEKRKNISRGKVFRIFIFTVSCNANNHCIMFSLGEKNISLFFDGKYLHSYFVLSPK